MKNEFLTIDDDAPSCPRCAEELSANMKDMNRRVNYYLDALDELMKVPLSQLSASDLELMAFASDQAFRFTNLALIVRGA